MNIEKIVNSKLYRFFDWAWRLAILNILTLITSLGVITLLSSLTACYQTIHDYTNGNERNVFYTYFHNLKRHFIEPLKGNIVIIIAAIVFVIALLFYSSNSNGEGFWTTISVIGFYFVVFLIAILLLVLLQLPIIYTNFHFRYVDNFRFAFLMAFRYFPKSILYAVSLVGTWALYIFFVPGWTVTCFSLPLFIGFILFKNVYWNLNHEVEEEKEHHETGN